MESKTRFVKPILCLCCAVIIAAGCIVSAVIFSGAVADRPLIGSFSGSLSSGGGYLDRDLMEIDALRMYLGLFPSAEDVEPYGDASDMPRQIMEPDPYTAAEDRLREALKSDILDGKWSGFPYVQLGDTLYFSKRAVDEWFYEQGKQQVRLP